MMRVPGCQKLQETTWLNPVWYRMLYSCTHMASVGVRVKDLYHISILRSFYKCNRSIIISFRKLCIR